MFYYEGTAYDMMYLNKDGIYLSRKVDEVEYARLIENEKEFEEIKIESDLSIKGMTELYANINDYETVIHALYAALSNNHNSND